jgi:hypothetical protein
MTITGRVRLALLGAVFAGTMAAGAAMYAAATEPVGVPARCPASDDLLGASETSPAVAQALRPGATLDVLVVGSAPLFGRTPPVPNTPGLVAFPWRMAEALETAVPGLKVAITVRGGHGATAGEMAGLIRDELAARSYQLVLWQTGSVEAVKNLPPGDFTQALEDGVDAATGHGVEVVLVDPQYSRFLQAHADVEPYERAFEQVAAIPGVELFPRFALMRRWAEDGGIDLERTAEADRKPALDLLHTCLGDYLARMVLAGGKS